jgi:hypothetical protein
MGTVRNIMLDSHGLIPPMSLRSSFRRSEFVLTSCSKVLFEQVSVTKSVKKFICIMIPDISGLRLQNPAFVIYTNRACFPLYNIRDSQLDSHWSQILFSSFAFKTLETYFIPSKSETPIFTTIQTNGQNCFMQKVIIVKYLYPYLNLYLKIKFSITNESLLLWIGQQKYLYSRLKDI